MGDRESTVQEICDKLRVDIMRQGNLLLALKTHSDFSKDENYMGQLSEMLANIMLAYRHLENARMRVGKILQAAGDGVSIFDKQDPDYTKSADRLEEKND